MSDEIYLTEDTAQRIADTVRIVENPTVNLSPPAGMDGVLVPSRVAAIQITGNIDSTFKVYPARIVYHDYTAPTIAGRWKPFVPDSLCWLYGDIPPVAPNDVVIALLVGIYSDNYPLFLFYQRGYGSGSVGSGSVGSGSVGSGSGQFTIEILTDTCDIFCPTSGSGNCNPVIGGMNEYTTYDISTMPWRIISKRQAIRKVCGGSGSGNGGNFAPCLNRNLNSTLYATLGGGNGTMVLTYNGTGWTGSKLLACGVTLRLNFTASLSPTCFFLAWGCNGSGTDNPGGMGVGSITVGPPFASVTYTIDMNSGIGGCVFPGCGSITVVVGE